jgi:hypothetical protein
LLYGCLQNFPRPFRSGDLSFENMGLRGTLDWPREGQRTVASGFGSRADQVLRNFFA